VRGLPPRGGTPPGNAFIARTLDNLTRFVTLIELLANVAAAIFGADGRRHARRRDALAARGPRAVLAPQGCDDLRKRAALSRARTA